MCALVTGVQTCALPILLALGQRQFGLDLVALPVQRRGHAGVAVALDAANQLVDLAPVQQQLAGAAVVGDDVAGGGDQRRDLGAEQEQLAAAHNRVALGDVGAAGADRLQLPALQRETGLETLLEVVLVARALVQRHGAAAVCLILVGFRSEEHTSELQSLMRNSYADFCLKKKNNKLHKNITTNSPNHHITTAHTL